MKTKDELTAILAELKAEVDAVPNEVDGINLGQDKALASRNLDMLQTQLLKLSKLSK